MPRSTLRCFFCLRTRGPAKIPAYLALFFVFHLSAAAGIAFGLLRLLLRPFLDIRARYFPLASSYLRAGKLSYLILYVTSRCNLKCEMCFYAESLNAPTGDGLTLAELEKVSKSLPHLMQLTLTGGEPFLRKDIDLIMGYFIENSGTRNLTIPTNGTYIEATERVLRAVCAKYPHATFKIGLSLDATKQTHNRIRGSDRSYDEVAATHALLRRLQKEYPNLIVTMTGVVSALNLPDLRALVDEYLEKFPSDDYALQLTRGKPKDPAAKEVPPAAYDAAVRYLDERLQSRAAGTNLTTALVRKLTARTRSIVARTASTNEFQVDCVAGGRLAVLYDTGILAPCEILPTLDLDPAVKAAHNGFNYGNVRDYDCDAQKALDGLLGRKIAAHIRDTKCRCTFECAVVASIFYQPAELVKTVAGARPPDQA